MAWCFFVLLNMALFIRPVELFPSIDLPIYNYLIWLCLITSGKKLIGLTNVDSLGRSPITRCVVGIVVAGMLSQLFRFQLGLVLKAAEQLLKLTIYYLLFITIVDSLPRLKAFLLWLTGFLIVATSLALLQLHGVISIAALEAYQEADIDPETGERYLIPRLRGTGMFNDPNDLSMILVYAILIALFFMGTRRGVLRFLWLAPLGLFGYALKMTYSRGGLLNLAMSLMVLFWVRFGWRKTFMVSGVILPVMLALFGGRQTRLDLGNSSDTSQGRIQAWAEGFALFRRSPIFGIGLDQYAEQLGYVAHNSYVHAYVELGFIGGTMFSGAFYTAIWGIIQLTAIRGKRLDPQMSELRPYLIAIIGSHCIGMLSLTRCYTNPTYMILGFGTAFLHIAERRCGIPAPRLDSQYLNRLVVVSLTWLILLLVAVWLTVRWPSV